MQYVIMDIEFYSVFNSQSQAVLMTCWSWTLFACHIKLRECKCHRNMAIDLQYTYKTDTAFISPKLAKVLIPGISEKL